jgi:shikimate dehydrogenase
LNRKEISEYQHLFGLIGYPLSHSFSKKYFSDKFLKEGIKNCYYELFPLKTIEEFPKLINDFPNLKGINVTLPYKESVLSFLDEIDEDAKEVGAVNTIKIESGKLSGYNTDVYGFENSLVHFMEKNPLKPIHNALILGTGGASKGMKYVLKKLKFSYLMVSRNRKKGDLTYEDLDEKILSNCQLIVNTTPLGMAPKTNDFPKLDYDKLNSNHFLFDLVYNPEKTVFLAKGIEQGCSVINGLSMLYLQAEKAWEIWNSEVDKKK